MQRNNFSQSQIFIWASQSLLLETCYSYFSFIAEKVFSSLQVLGPTAAEGNLPCELFHFSGVSDNLELIPRD